MSQNPYRNARPCIKLTIVVAASQRISVVFIVLVPTSRRRRPARPIRAEPFVLRVRLARLAIRIFSGDGFARVDPVRVHVHGGREVVDAGLELLAADFAVQLAVAELLVELDDDCFLVVAEEARKGRGEGFALWER